MPGSIPAQRTENPRSNWCAAPRSPRTTGEDWSNVTLGVSTVRTARGGSAPELNSLIVQYPQPPRPLPVGAPRMPRSSRDAGAAAGAGTAELKVAEEQQATVEVGGFQVTFKIPGRVSLGASEGAKALRISTATIAPDLAVRSVPVRDPDRVPRSQFQAERGRAAAAGPGLDLSRWRVCRPRPMAGGSKDETVRLGFGADDKVKIERTVLKRNEGSAGLIVTTSKTDERAFKTTVRNGHDFPIRIAIEDQLPVSENEEIQVEMLPSTTPPTATNLRDKRGVLEWAFEAKPGEVKDIAFAWRVRWPKDKGVVMTPGG